MVPFPESPHGSSSSSPEGAPPAIEASVAPLLLALSIHADDCSVALGTERAASTEFWSRQPERQHPGVRSTAQAQGPLASRDALVLLDRLLSRASIRLSQVTGLAFAQGPGAFTSLRVAAGLVQGLGLALSLPVAGICSFAAMAAQAPGWREPGAEWLQLGAIDARMGECYYAVHRCRAGAHPEPLAGPLVGSAAEAIAAFERFRGEGAACVAAGNAFVVVPALAQWASSAGLDPEAAGRRGPTADAVLAVATSRGAPAGGPPEAALPVYVRDKVALDLREQRLRAVERASGAAEAARG
ncbi:MAG: tRNA (adenosine(37)-N6)-threonylcarbamoyltransferase complex dimerization subunit type 1 TsaB [Burkholderiaceae bacterium]|nr:tRNA (adenosine(37)-N6)-threonylcarbamoyltransferase complex dimerization subunit type 1 TsaB [Burkholderiaceae bacterium]